MMQCAGGVPAGSGLGFTTPRRISSKSQYERGNPALAFAARARSLSTTNETPGEDIRHFWDAVIAASTPHVSNSNGIPPIDDTPSTRSNTLRARVIRATPATSFATPVEVSP